MVMNDEIKSILLIRLSAIGDCIHIIPSVNAIRAKYPDARIDWLIEDRAIGAVDGLTSINTFLQVPRRKWKKEKTSLINKAKDILALRKKLKETSYDVAIDFQGLTKSGVWALLSACKKVVGYKGVDSREINGWFVTDKIEPICKHVVDRNMELLKAIGITDPVVKWELPVANGLSDKMSEFLKLHKLIHNGFVILNPGAGWKTKCWDVERFGVVAKIIYERFNIRSVLTWAGADEEEMVKTIFNFEPEGAIIAPSTTLEELAQLCRVSTVFVGNDTGPLHIAVATGTKTVSMFGASDAIRNGAYGEEHICFQDTSIKCVPCWNRNECNNNLECLNAISVASVVDAIKKQWGNENV